MDKEQALQIAEQYAEIVAKEFNPKQILLFGSHLNGTPHEYSDIDIAVVPLSAISTKAPALGGTALPALCRYVGT
jgi:predicted nucleotidyltransferase